MPKLKLPEVTLVLIDNLDYELSELSMKDTLKHVDFEDVHIWSDKKLNVPGATHFPLPIPLRNMHDHSCISWYHMWKPIKTSHFLLVQWDSWVIDPNMWTDEFLEYDYLGTPWWHADGMNVGSGGFTLRSVRLHKYIAEHPSDYPLIDPEDITLSRIHRPNLELNADFKWPRHEFDALAQQFGFEVNRGGCVGGMLYSAPRIRHFGFHALRNWPLVLTEEEMEERLKLLDDRKYRDDQMQFLRANVAGLKRFGKSCGYQYTDMEIRDERRPGTPRPGERGYHDKFEALYK